MNASVLGRTNQAFPKLWLRLTALPHGENEESLSDYVATASSLQVPMDISASPALFGGLIPEIGDRVLVQVSATDFELATDSKHAADLVQAHLIQTLSSMGRSYIDFYFLRFRHALEESQICGIMEALEAARHEGHVRFLGLFVESYGAAVGNWQFHDAFEVVSVPATLKPQDRESLKRMAKQRRVGFLVRSETMIPLEPDESLILRVGSVKELLAVREKA